MDEQRLEEINSVTPRTRMPELNPACCHDPAKGARLVANDRLMGERLPKCCLKEEKLKISQTGQAE